MIGKILTFRASESEWEALNWFADLGEFMSGSAAIRAAVVQLAAQTSGFPEELLRRMKNMHLRPIRSGQMRPSYGNSSPLLDVPPLTPKKRKALGIGQAKRLAPRKPINGKPVRNKSGKKKKASPK